MQWALVLQRAGIGLASSEIGDREPRVRRVLKALPPLTLPLWLVTHREVRSSRRVRVVADVLASAVGGQGGDPGTPRWSGREVERTGPEPAAG